MTAENLTPILLEAVKNQAPEDYAEKLHDVALEVLNMRSDLINELNRLFFENDDCTDLNFLTHEFLLLPDSPVTNMAILSAAEKLKRFIPPLLHRHVLTQWQYLKSQYQIYFRTPERTVSQVLDLLLENELFNKLSAINPILISLKTISATSVPVEREFSILHYTKRKERSRFSTSHLAVLTRISHNAPVLLSTTEIEEIQILRRQLAAKKKMIRDSPTGADESEDIPKKKNRQIWTL
ncbi:hypothetical protein BLNAU_22070 [Blattamonas nauphoetae]|uniref:HAT C-terminal dimerisation domain-containing protein n=1 Tax=Blattamonas nauphoetae TaxID=2049346 RepID=A0ABQ9WU31_9EUKA|nr:hypothetical protein BLNAU_22070 [Blattamonas nauphoetae]